MSADSSSSSQLNPLGKKFIRMLSALIIGYALIVATVGIFQRRWIYFPNRFPLESALAAAKEHGFNPWRNAAGEIIGWQMSGRTDSAACVLVTHGNGGCALERDYIARPIHTGLGLDVFVLEFPGYGARSGSPTMTSILAAAEEAFALLPADKPVYLVSESLGAGPAAYLAQHHATRVKGMAMLVPYDDLPSLAQYAMPWLPAKWLVLDRYKPALWLRDYRAPIKFVLAEADQVIPAKFGQRLYDAYQGPKSLQLVTGAAHNEVAEQSPEWWKEVWTFWQSAAKASDHAPRDAK